MTCQKVSNYKEDWSNWIDEKKMKWNTQEIYINYWFKCFLFRFSTVVVVKEINEVAKGTDKQTKNCEREREREKKVNNFYDVTGHTLLKWPADQLSKVEKKEMKWEEESIDLC